MNGARGVQRDVLAKVDDESLEVFVVWMGVMRGRDTREAAIQSMAVVPDGRAQHFYIGDWTLGEAIDDVIELPLDPQDPSKPVSPLAWDVYLVFDTAAQWGDEPPSPQSWMHQLGVVDDRRFSGSKLREQVEAMLETEAEPEPPVDEDDSAEDF